MIVLTGLAACAASARRSIQKGLQVQLQKHQHRTGIQNLSIDLKFFWEERFHQLLNVAICLLVINMDPEGSYCSRP